MVEQGLVNLTGLISYGRGEVFDYLMGERAIAPALEAEKVIAAYLLRARNPVALYPKGLIKLAEVVSAKIEVNIFHRTKGRMENLVSYMESQGAEHVLGRNPDAMIPKLTLDRALCTKERVFNSDVIVVLIEDGDKVGVLVAMGKAVISIGLNPISRTSKSASVPISDEIIRALENITRFAGELKSRDGDIDSVIRSYSNARTRRDTIECICGVFRPSSKNKVIKWKV